MLEELRGRHPQQVGLHIGFDEERAHHVEAGADAFLMPSLYEPSGLNQLYSMKYGTPPVVRATGGLADTVTDYSPEALASGQATGFRFIPYSADGLLDAVSRALDLYYHRPDDWLRLAQNGMRRIGRGAAALANTSSCTSGCTVRAADDGARASRPHTPCGRDARAPTDMRMGRAIHRLAAALGAARC